MSDITFGLFDTEFDTETDTLLATLDDGATISASLLTDTTTFVVMVDPSSAQAGSHRGAVLRLTDGETDDDGRDNNGPYSLFGDNNKGDYDGGVDLLAGECQFVVERHSNLLDVNKGSKQAALRAAGKG